MNYSGPSLYAMAKREREQLADYDECRESFECMLENQDLWSYDLAEWFGNGGVTDYAPIFKVLVAARDRGCEEAKALLAGWADSYAKARS
jgi:hypothetical protein